MYDNTHNNDTTENIYENTGKSVKPEIKQENKEYNTDKLFENEKIFVNSPSKFNNIIVDVIYPQEKIEKKEDLNKYKENKEKIIDINIDNKDYTSFEKNSLISNEKEIEEQISNFNYIINNIQFF